MHVADICVMSCRLIYVYGWTYVRNAVRRVRGPHAGRPDDDDPVSLVGLPSWTNALHQPVPRAPRGV